MIRTEQPQSTPEGLSENLEKKIIDIAINDGNIKKEEIYKHRFGTSKSYKGEGVVELEGVRYKVVGHPLEIRQGDVVKEGWVQVYKMRDWQE